VLAHTYEDPCSSVETSSDDNISLQSDESVNVRDDEAHAKECTVSRSDVVTKVRHYSKSSVQSAGNDSAIVLERQCR
jgi:hypothetical protein